MKNINNLFSFWAIALLVMACTEDNVPTTFDIEGNWAISKVVVGWGQPDRSGLLVMACTEDNVPTTFDIEGNWAISKVVVGWGQPDRSGAEIPFTDTYTFEADGTFTRKSVDGEIERAASGVYVVSAREENDPSSHLFRVNLTYQTGADLASNCYSVSDEASREILVVLEDHSLVTTWQACDGPAYYYERG